MQSGVRPDAMGDAQSHHARARALEACAEGREKWGRAADPDLRRGEKLALRARRGGIGATPPRSSPVRAGLPSDDAMSAAPPATPAPARTREAGSRSTDGSASVSRPLFKGRVTPRKARAKGKRRPGEPTPNPRPPSSIIGCSAARTPGFRRFLDAIRLDDSPADSHTDPDRPSIRPRLADRLPTGC